MSVGHQMAGWSFQRTSVRFQYKLTKHSSYAELCESSASQAATMTAVPAAAAAAASLSALL